jgi:hypothetical protein
MLQRLAGPSGGAYQELKFWEGCIFDQYAVIPQYIDICHDCWYTMGFSTHMITDYQPDDLCECCGEQVVDYSMRRIYLKDGPLLDLYRLFAP